MPRSAELTAETFKPLLRKLHDSPADFTADDVRLSMEHMLKTPPAPTAAQIGAFLATLQQTGVAMLPSTLATAADVLLKHAIVPHVEGDEAGIRADIVGTGGDGHNVFNFLLAATYHPALAALASIRKQLPFRTLYNMLGPLANPARPTHMVLGVAKRELGPLFARALAENPQRSLRKALVVCGAEGLDELSCAGESYVWTVDTAAGTITEATLTPEDFGLPRHSLDTVRGHSPVENAEVLKALLEPEYISHDREVPLDLVPVRDFVSMNASALLVVSGVATDWKDGVRLASESISSGRAWSALEQFRDLSVKATRVD